MVYSKTENALALAFLLYAAFGVWRDEHRKLLETRSKELQQVSRAPEWQRLADKFEACFVYQAGVNQKGTSPSLTIFICNQTLGQFWEISMLHRWPSNMSFRPWP
jgi:hypothetical protein